MENRLLRWCGKTPPITAINKNSLLTLTSVSETTILIVQLATLTDEAGLLELHKLISYSMDD